MDWQQRFFNPSDHDDRLLLDLKGTMSEAPLAEGREDGAQNLARLTIAVAPGPSQARAWVRACPSDGGAGSTARLGQQSAPA